MNLPNSDDRQWFCVRAQTKREHIAAGHLSSLEGVEVFCPRIRYRKATRRGKVWWLEPLFPGYLLAKFDLKEMERAVTFCQGIRGLVRFGSEIPNVPHAFVETLMEQVAAKLDDEGCIAVSPSITEGDEVEVADGPFRGMTGVVQSIAPATERVRILLEFLGETQPVNMDLFSILLPSKPIPNLDP